MIRSRLDGAVDSHRLLEHPFYVAWREGTLPGHALATYAREYGAFIAAVPAGWETAGDSEHAAEERDHAVMWDRFAGSLGTAIGEPELPEVRSLLDTADRLFGDRVSALGALFAFESQQPDTAREKMDGLVAHYGFDSESTATEYFRVHAGDYHEADQIVAMLDAADIDQAAEACDEMSTALWRALDGVLATV